MADVISTDLRYVAYFDMLGMSQLTVRDPDLAWQALSGLSNAHQEILGLEIELTPISERIRDHVRAFTFSDSIVMFTRRYADTSGGPEKRLRSKLKRKHPWEIAPRIGML